LEEDVSQPLLEKKCIMAKVLGTNVQMEVISWTHLVEKMHDGWKRMSHGLSSRKNA
jgi:hypothetical protein